MADDGKGTEAAYQQLFESNPHPMWVYDLETLAFLAVNNAAIHQYGYSRDQFLSMTIKDIRPPEDIPWLLDNVSNVTEGLDEAGTWRHLRRDGSVIDVEVTSHTLTFQGRKAELVLAYNVTQRRAAEDRLKSQAYQQAMLAHLGREALSSVKLSEFVTNVVKTVATSLGVEYCKVLELLPGGDAFLLQAGVGWMDGYVGHATVGAESASQAGYTLLSDEPVVVDDLRTEERFGETPLLEEHNVVSGMSVIIEGRKRPYGVLGAHTTHRRVFTEDDTHFLQAAANLLGMSIERNRTEREMIQVERLRALGEMAAGISHNLNNMLVGVLGPAQLLKARATDPGMLEDIDTIVASALRASDLVHHLHSSVRESKEDDLKSVQINGVVKDAVQASVSRWKDEPEARGISVHVDQKLSEVPPIRGTESGLNDILLNLLFNAVDAMPEGGTVLIRTEATEGHVVLSVSDTGMGMDEITRSRLFEPFFTTKAEVGTGLGLHTTYNTVSSWGGIIETESSPGQGTTFAIRFPIGSE